jgi:hypothetical protein
MAVAKRFEVYRESDILRHPLRAEAYGPVCTQSLHAVKIYSREKGQFESYSLQTVIPFSSQLWSKDLGLLISSSSPPVSFRERLGFSYQLNPYVTPYSLNGTDLFTFQSPFRRVFLLPQAFLGMQENSDLVHGV